MDSMEYRRLGLNLLDDDAEEEEMKEEYEEHLKCEIDALMKCDKSLTHEDAREQIEEGYRGQDFSDEITGDLQVNNTALKDGACPCTGQR